MTLEQEKTPYPDVHKAQSVPKRRSALRYAIYAVAVLAAVSALDFVYRTITPANYRDVGRELRLAQAAERNLANGFDISNATIPREEIRSGGPPRDGIPAILHPRFVPVERATFLDPRDKVVGFTSRDTARAYPLRILVWHEIVNDTVGDVPVAVTYCPLCGTSMVFDRRYGDETLTFGVSGLLYQSDVLMYDHQSESLWSQLKMESVSGDNSGTRLKWLYSEEMTWDAWKEAHPDGEVLAPASGYNRDYSRNPYSGYEHIERTYFPVPKYRTELPNKEWVIGVLIDGIAKAYPIKALENLGSSPLRDTVGGKPILILYDKERQWPKIGDAETGAEIPYVKVYWFAWQAFYPESLLHGY